MKILAYTVPNISFKIAGVEFSPILLYGKPWPPHRWCKRKQARLTTLVFRHLHQQILPCKSWTLDPDRRPHGAPTIASRWFSRARWWVLSWLANINDLIGRQSGDGRPRSRPCQQAETINGIKGSWSGSSGTCLPLLTVAGKGMLVWFFQDPKLKQVTCDIWMMQRFVVSSQEIVCREAALILHAEPIFA